MSELRIADALRLLRTRAGLTQTAASKRPGAPDFRTLSHWETRRKQPSLRLLHGYLESLGLDFGGLQEALDQITGREPQATREAGARFSRIEKRLSALERAAEGQTGGPAEVEAIQR